MTGQAIIAKLKDLSPIEGADRIQQAKIYGETVIVSKDYKEGELGILFDMETQLSHEFCHYNNLYRHSHFNEDQSKEGYIADNRRIKPIRLKGVQCSGFWVPISYLSYIDRCFGYDSSKEDGASSLKEGNQFTEIDEKEICKKWVPVRTRTKGSGGKSKKQKVSLKDLAPIFKEHIDTDHWARNMHQVTPGDLVILTEKLHGTSARCSNSLIVEEYPWWKKWIAQIALGIENAVSGSYRLTIGSRRSVKYIDDIELSDKKHYYSSDLWTKISKENFEGKLEKGETVYFEIVGYTPEGKPIMGTYSNEKLKSFMDKKEYKKFIDTYGKHTVFNYGCIPHVDAAIFGNKVDMNPGYHIFVYRITVTNPEGVSLDMSWEQVKRRCEQLGVDHVPELARFIATPYTKESESKKVKENYLGDHYGQDINNIVEDLTHDDSKNFPDHLREGVVVRIEHGGSIPTMLKHKNYYYRVLEGQIKEPTMEDEN